MLSQTWFKRENGVKTALFLVFCRFSGADALWTVREIQSLCDRCDSKKTQIARVNARARVGRVCACGRLLELLAVVFVLDVFSYSTSCLFLLD